MPVCARWNTALAHAAHLQFDKEHSSCEKPNGAAPLAKAAAPTLARVHIAGHRCVRGIQHVNARTGPRRACADARVGARSPVYARQRYLLQDPSVNIGTSRYTKESIQMFERLGVDVDELSIVGQAPLVGSAGLGGL
jgi:hypothetical protein